MGLKSFCRYLPLCIILIAGKADYAHAQQKAFTGVIRNDSAGVLPSASVNLINDKAAVISFAITNKKGEYSLLVPSVPPGTLLWLEVSYIGYKRQRKAVEPDRYSYDFALIADTNLLDDVLARNKPLIESLGDTIRYYVQSFAKKEDRSIGDVLRRLPGITVDVDGTIYYNGKMIENLYIQGDDLMDGRYGLAPKVIRKELISTVDVIRNHQPIEVLRNKELSEKTAINLVLKDEKTLKVSAKTMVGAGLPEQYDVSFTPIILNERIKMINVLALNNSGVDYKNDFKQLGSPNMVSNIDGDAPAGITLSLATIGPPDLPLANYYFNRSGIVNLNNLYKTNKGIQYKANVQLFYDRNSLNFYNQAANYLPTGDTIIFRETQSVTNKPLFFYSSLNVMINRGRYFFNNNSRVNLSRNMDNSQMDFNNYSFGQKLRKTVREFSNDLNWIPAFHGKGIGEIRWLISYASDRQQLDIGEGYYADIVSQQDYYDRVVQNMRIPSLFSNAYFSYRMPGIVLNQEYKIGYKDQSKTLESNLAFDKIGLTIPYSGDAGNDLHWNLRSAYLSADYQLKYKKITTFLKLPLAFQSIRFYQQQYNLDSRNKDLVFTPDLMIRYDITTEQSLFAKYRFGNSFGSISNVYRGAILQNYRMLLANDAELQERKIHSASISYEYQKSITMLFMNTSFSWDRIQQNSILAASVSNNIQRIILLPYKNSQTKMALNSVFSKYLFNLKSTASVKWQISRFKYIQLINGEYLPFYSDVLSVNGNLIKKIFGKISLTYQPAASWSASKVNRKDTPVAGDFSSKTFRFDQNLSVSANLKKLYVEMNGRHSYSTQTNSTDLQYFFMDAKLRFSNIKKKVDLNLDITNLFNIKNYIRYNVSSNQLVQDQYTIRGRMVILRAEYYF